jgi:arylsulfatase A-like enzyme
VLFERAYCTAPHCNPSRTSVFTGLRPTTTGVYHGEFLQAPPARTSLPEHFRAQGFATFAAGKVFHGQYDYAAATKRYATSAAWLDTHGSPELWDEYHACDAEPLPDGRPFNGFFDFRRDEVPDWYCHFDWGPLADADAAALPDLRVVERAEAFLASPHERPFFAAVGFYRPHLPWYLPQRFFDLHPLETVVLPEVRADELDGVPPIARGWATTPNDHDRVVAAGQWRQAVRGYLAATSFCDSLVGRLVAALDASGRARDTLVVLWGDNGFHLGEKLHWRKFTLWEEATRVPLVIVDPRRGAGRCAAPVSLLDLFPTLCDLAALPQPGGLEGESLAAQVVDPAAPRRALPIATWGRGNHSVRSARFRYTRYADGSQELYDHALDPRERANLALDPTHQGVIAELAPRLDALEEAR